VWRLLVIFAWPRPQGLGLAEREGQVKDQVSRTELAESAADQAGTTRIIRSLLSEHLRLFL
jgi:hypothetical protein